jgi:hypothetical protein
VRNTGSPLTGFNGGRDKNRHDNFYHIDSTYLDFSCASCHSLSMQK